MALLSPLAGALAAGFHFGKNTYDSAAIGFRFGFVAAGLIWAGSLVLTALVYGLHSSGVELGGVLQGVGSIAGGLLIDGLAYVPISAVAGAVIAALGTLLRHMIVPTEYNPRLH